MIVSSSFSSALTITDSSGACFSTSIVGCSISVLRLISSDNIVSSCSTLEATNSSCRLFSFNTTTSFSSLALSICSATVL
ncbi:Late competence protein ComEA DNA receptor [Bacillus cereus]|uniref:Late competence protein ComEA DNA receptor n=1 Tax=Bacillus cereus TaxID=1396 RepID=A0A164FZV1_BACCE|nr:Late competence protein ComEA DNA receptor [Bacillus cereus]